MGEFLGSCNYMASLRFQQLAFFIVSRNVGRTIRSNVVYYFRFVRAITVLCNGLSISYFRTMCLNGLVQSQSRRRCALIAVHDEVPPKRKCSA